MRPALILMELLVQCSKCRHARLNKWDKRTVLEGSVLGFIFPNKELFDVPKAAALWAGFRIVDRVEPKSDDEEATGLLDPDPVNT